MNGKVIETASYLLRLEASQLAALHRAARKREIPTSKYVRQALAAALEADGEQWDDTKPEIDGQLAAFEEQEPDT